MICTVTLYRDALFCLLATIRNKDETIDKENKIFAYQHRRFDHVIVIYDDRDDRGAPNGSSRGCQSSPVQR